MRCLVKYSLIVFNFLYNNALLSIVECRVFMVRSLLGLFLVVLTFLFAEPLCNGNGGAKSFCSGWESLQQLRSLIPERIWDQEFQIQVNRRAFMRSAEKWMKKDVASSCVAIGGGHSYFLRSTMSGENVRILDRYQEFQWSPFWKNPPMEESLRNLENQTMKEVP